MNKKTSRRAGVADFSILIPVQVGFPAAGAAKFGRT
jgi:hypothetical protein